MRLRLLGKLKSHETIRKSIYGSVKLANAYQYSPELKILQETLAKFDLLEKTTEKAKEKGFMIQISKEAFEKYALELNKNQSLVKQIQLKKPDLAIKIADAVEQDKAISR